MPKVIFGASPASTVIRIKLLDASQTDGKGITGLSFSATGLTISTIKSNEAAATYYTAAGNTIETIATLGTYVVPLATKCRFKEVDSTYHKGIYELQFADARLSGADSVLVSIAGATNLAESDFEIQCKNLAADIKAIDGQLTNGNNATLNLKQLNIQNNSGMGVYVQGSDVALSLYGEAGGIAITCGNCGSDAVGIEIHGSGDESAIRATGGDDGGHGMELLGGVISGDALHCTTPTEGHGVYIESAGAQSGIHIKSSATGGQAAILAEGQGNQSGFVAWGGNTGGSAVLFKARAGNSNGLKVEGFGTGEGAEIDGGNSGGNALQLNGGGTSGKGASIIGGSAAIGLAISGGSSTGKGMTIESNEIGLYIASVTSQGIWAQGSSGIVGVAKAEGGVGIYGDATDTSTGVGFCATGGTTGDGARITSSGTGNGLVIIGNNGMYVQGNLNNGVQCVGNTVGFSCAGVGGGMWLYGTDQPGLELGSCSSNDIKFTNNSIGLSFDSTPFSTIMGNLLSMASGKFKKDFPNPGDVTFYLQDNVTPALTMNITTTQRTRTYP